MNIHAKGTATIYPADTAAQASAIHWKATSAIAVDEARGCIIDIDLDSRNLTGRLLDAGWEIKDADKVEYKAESGEADMDIVNLDRKTGTAIADKLQELLDTEDYFVHTGIGMCMEGVHIRFEDHNTEIGVYVDSTWGGDDIEIYTGNLNLYVNYNALGDDDNQELLELIPNGAADAISVEAAGENPLKAAQWIATQLTRVRSEVRLGATGTLYI